MQCHIYYERIHFKKMIMLSSNQILDRKNVFNKNRSFLISKHINLSKSWNVSDKNQHGYLDINSNYQAVCWHTIVDSAFSDGHSGFISNLRWASYVAWSQLSLGRFWIWRNQDPVGPENFKVLLKYIFCVKYSLMELQELLHVHT